MTQRQAGKAQRYVFAGAPDRERWGANGHLVPGSNMDTLRRRGDIVQQCKQFTRAFAIVEVGCDLDGTHKALQIASQLLFEILIKHDSSPRLGANRRRPLATWTTGPPSLVRRTDRLQRKT